ncbi:MAG: hypothetical protein IIB43_00885 [Candidatus Marinimicrobia bacterium]|nr:hypothetical protein [Candidatus Neomarinimicrobiota bacterium]
MTTALATLLKHRSVILIDVALLAALYLLPSFSHLIALPLLRFEPMRVALLVALLFTNRANTYFIAFTIPLVSTLVTGHPVPLKAVLMGVEFSILVATYSYLARLERIPTFAALTAGILLGKLAYYALKFGTLRAGLLTGSLISTPLQNQLILVLVTAAVFGRVEYYRMKSDKILMPH